MDKVSLSIKQNTDADEEKRLYNFIFSTRLFAPDAEALLEVYRTSENIEGEEVQEIGAVSGSLNSHVEFSDIVQK